MRAGSPRVLRELNDRAAIDALLRSGPMTRADLEGLIGLSKPATAELLARLEKADHLRRHGLRDGGRGPKAQLWSVNGALAHAAALALTPDTIDIAVADITGVTLAELRAPMPSAGQAEVLAGFVSALEEVTALAGLTRDDVSHIVIGGPGALDPGTGELRFAPHMPGWDGIDLPTRLSATLDASVSVENDVNLVALEEMLGGNAVDAGNFVLIWPTDEVGAAVVINRVLLRGATGGAGEIDGMMIPDLAEADTGTSRQARYGELLSIDSITRLAAAHHLDLPAGVPPIRVGVEAGDAGLGFLRDLARWVATGVANVISIVDPDLILLSAKAGERANARFCELVADELVQFDVPQTLIGPAVVAGNPVRAGAMHCALAAARQDVFGLSPAPDIPAPQYTSTPYRSIPYKSAQSKTAPLPSLSPR